MRKYQRHWTGKSIFLIPNSSWERGTNENTNGLIRQYFPKDHDFTTITNEQLKAVQEYDIGNSLGDDGPPDCDDITNAATSFGVTVEQLIDAGLPPPPGLDCEFI